MPEGNGKTTLMSGIALYHADYTPEAQVVLGASSRDQCEWLHNQAAGFVRRTPGLEQRFRVFDGYRRIKAHRSRGRIQVYAADDRTGDGVIFTLALLDELHRHRDLRLYRTWRGKSRKRGGQLAAISTAGEPDSEFEQIRAKVKTEAPELKRDGAYTRAASPGMVLHDHAVPPDGDVEDMDQVKAANPLATVTAKSLGEDRASPTMSALHWRRFKCNQAVRGIESAIDEAEWAAAGTQKTIPTGQHIWAGLDLGWKWDCTAWAPLWMRDREYRLFGKPKILTPPRDGTSLHPEQVKDAFREINSVNPVDTVVMDPNAGAEEIAAWLRDEFGVRVVEHSQSDGAMAVASERFLEGLREGWLFQPQDPEFTRHVLNAQAKLLRDGRTRFVRPSTARDSTGQDRRVIDGLVAAAMVHSSAVGEELSGGQEPTDLLEYSFDFI